MDSERRLIAVQLDGLQIRSRTTLFTVGPEYRVSGAYDFYDISMDDQQFLMERLQREERGEVRGKVIFVQNFFEELRRLTPN